MKEFNPGITSLDKMYSDQLKVLKPALIYRIDREYESFCKKIKDDNTLGIVGKWDIYLTVSRCYELLYSHFCTIPTESMMKYVYFVEWLLTQKNILKYVYDECELNNYYIDNSVKYPRKDLVEVLSSKYYEKFKIKHADELSKGKFFM